MNDALIGELRSFVFSFTPTGFLPCNGQTLTIAKYSALFSLLGTAYGGDGTTSFALPDLRGRSMVHSGAGVGLSNIKLGQRGGTERVTLAVSNMPAHTHAAQLYAEGAAGTSSNPSGNMLGGSAIYATPGATPNKALDAESISVESAGGGVGFSVRSPYVGVNICIAITGIFPPRS